MPNFRRGREAIEKSASRKGGGGRSFVPDIYWEDGEKKHVLLLTPVGEVPTLDMHSVLPVVREREDGSEYTIWESVVARTDEAIGEDSDPLNEQFDLVAKERCLGAAVELEPVFKTERGRKRVKGFTVKTEEYTRRTDDGEETVEGPKIGLIVLWGGYLWPQLLAIDEAKGPLCEVPLEIARKGSGLDTEYTAIDYAEEPIDLAPLLENVEGIGYLQGDLDNVLAAIEAEKDELGAAQAIARVLFEKRIDELADEDRYDDILENIDESQIKTWGEKKEPKKARAKKRPERPSSRKTKAKVKKEKPEPEAEVETEAEGDEGEEKSSEAFDALRARLAGAKS